MVSRRLKVVVLFAVAIFAVTAAYAGDYTHQVIPPADPSRVAFKELWNLRCNNQTGAELTVYLRGYLIHNGATVLSGKSGNTLKIPVGMSTVRHDRITSIQESYCAPGYEGFLTRGQVPAGVYDACIAAYDAGTNQLLDSNCTRFEPVIPGAPRLISPADGAVLGKGQEQPLYTWTRPMPAPRGAVTYDLTIVNMLPTQTAITAMRDNKPFFKKTRIAATNFKYSGPPFEKSKKYAWGVYFAGKISDIFTFSLEGAAPPPPPETGAIRLLAPIGKLNKWSGLECKWELVGPARRVKNVQFELEVVQLPADSADSVRSVLHEEGIRGTSYRLPELDTTKSYAWRVRGRGPGGLLFDGPPGTFGPFEPRRFCGWMIWMGEPTVYYMCMDGDVDIHFGRFMDGGQTGPITWTITLVDPWHQETYVNYAHDLTLTPYIPTGSNGLPVPGLYTYKAQASRGTCTAGGLTRSLRVYPSVKGADVVKAGGASMQGQDVCYMEQGQLVVPALKDVTPAPDLRWYWRQRQFQGCELVPPWAAWSNWQHWADGNGVNTQPFAELGGCPSLCGHFQRQYKIECGDPSQINITNAECLRKLLTPVTVYCDPKGTLSCPPQFCGTSNVTLSVVNAYSGSTYQWYENSTPISNATGPILSLTAVTPGTHRYSVSIWNGPCGPLTLSCDVQVFEPLTNCDIDYSTPSWTPLHKDAATRTSEVCPCDDAKLLLTNPPASANLEVKWQYDINCTGNWTDFTPIGNAYSHNTNEICALPDGQYGMPSPFTSLCWRAVIHNLDWTGDPSSPCHEKTTEKWQINIIQEPCKPALTCAGGLAGLACTKCAGSSVTLTAAFAAGCDATYYTYQWLFNDLPYTGGGATITTIQPVEPGFYSLMVNSKYGCSSVQSDPIEVKDCVFDLAIAGPNCADPNAQITLKVVDRNGGTNFSSCGGPYTYLWSTGATAQTITVTPYTSPPPPPQCGTTVTYTVTVTDGRGCTATASKTVLVCP